MTGNRCAILFVVLAGWCTVAAGAPAPAAESVLVFAASSTEGAIGEVAELYRARTGVRVVGAYGSSGALARQIESGAPADIVIAADQGWADYLDRRGRLLPGARTVLLHNRLVLIAPATSRLALAIAPGFALRPALGDGRLAIADPAHAPAGAYAREALTRLGVWESVADRLAPVDNVRAVVALIERGEAPAGIAYATDAAITARVRVVAAFPPETHAPIAYPLAIVAGRDRPPVRAFFDFLQSAPARAVYLRLGFAAD